MNFFLQMKKSITGDFFSPAGYFFLGWILLYVCLGVFISLQSQWTEEKKSLSLVQALKYCFPSKNMWGPSARLDYKILFFSHYLIRYPLGLFLLLGQDNLARSIAPWLADRLSIFGKFHFPVSNGIWTDLVYTVLVLLAADLGWTVQHILFHRVPRLWEFHKVHHSATELNIFTIARLHPVDVLSQGWAAGISIGIFMGLCKFGLGYTPSLVLFMNVSGAMAFFRILGIYRHSHIWISFGPVLSRFFCSPAMHQIHHSADKKHHDKNFSTVFSFWDLVFGTLYVPPSREVLQFGLEADGSIHPRYGTYLGSLLSPFFSERFLARYEHWRGKGKSMNVRGQFP